MYYVKFKNFRTDLIINKQRKFIFDLKSFRTGPICRYEGTDLGRNDNDIFNK